jgi:ABC-type lipoprotein export system ATPase subunit
MSNQAEHPLLRAQHIEQSFMMGKHEHRVLTDINVYVNPGEMIAIEGQSGSGKTTLLSILAGLQKPLRGSITFSGHDLFALSAQQQAVYRNQAMGFIYQQHHLMHELTVLENVSLPLLIGGMGYVQAMECAARVLQQMHLEDYAQELIHTLSSGQRQRVAFARASIVRPKIIFADEPTGSLDQAMTHDLIDVCCALKQQRQVALVIVTHDPAVAKRMDRRYQLRLGTLHQV